MTSERKVQEVVKFRYLGSNLREGQRWEEEIKARITMAQEAFTKKKKIFCRNMNYSEEETDRVPCMEILLYWCKIWTMGRRDSYRFQAFEIWTQRRMGINWIDRVTNKKVLIGVWGNRKRIWIRQGRKNSNNCSWSYGRGGKGRGRKRLKMVFSIKRGRYKKQRNRHAAETVNEQRTVGKSVTHPFSHCKEIVSENCVICRFEINKKLPGGLIVLSHFFTDLLKWEKCDL